MRNASADTRRRATTRRPTPRTTARPDVRTGTGIRTLAVDVGATRIKATLLNELGEPLDSRTRRRTPKRATPDAVLDVIAQLADDHPGYDRISVGFPGVVHHGIVRVAPNLSRKWGDFHLVAAVATRFGVPVRAANDADVQGFGAIAGNGVELVITLGTGVGSALFVDGRLVPNLEIGDDAVSNAELHRVGKRKWTRRVARMLRRLDAIFCCDRIYLGGGNARHLDIGKLPHDVTVVSNLTGMVGGVALWRDAARGALEPMRRRATALPAPPRARLARRAVAS